jgi:thioesterase domain-containing protein
MEYDTGMVLPRYMLALADHEMRRFHGPVELFLSEDYRSQTAISPSRGWERWADRVRVHPLLGDHWRCLMVDPDRFRRSMDEIAFELEATNHQPTHEPDPGPRPN